MKFVSIPNYGASWREALNYSFSTETSEPQDIKVEVVDARSSELLGEMRLYGVTKGVVNIAPYVARRASLLPPTSGEGLVVVQSPSAVAVVVRINGVSSAERIFFRSAFNPDLSRSLSYYNDNQEVEKGDVIRLTLHAKREMWIAVSYSRGVKVQPIDTTIACDGCPMELMLSTNGLNAGDTISLTIRYDAGSVQGFRFTVMPRRMSSKRLLWYNPYGGVECYTFGHSIRIGYGVEVQSVDECAGEARRCVEGELRYRLCSGQESTTVLERVAELLLSPVVYKCGGAQCEVVDIASREVDYNGKGELHNMTLEVCEEWRGGGLW